MSPSELTNTIAQFIVYVHRNEVHFTYIYVYHMNVSEADNIYKNPPPNVISPIFFAIYISLWGSTHDSARALTDPRLPATASNVCTTDARLGGVGRVPPQTKILATPVYNIYEVPPPYRSYSLSVVEGESQDFKIIMIIIINVLYSR